MTDSDEYRIAVHEAGHAVVGRVLGMVCGPVSIRPDDDSVGHAITADPWAIYGEWERRGRFREMRAVFVGRILTFMAGAEAETSLLGGCPGGGDGDDRMQIAMMLEEIVDDDDCERIESRLRRSAAALCRRHASKIERLAGALLARGHIDDDAEIRRIADIPEPDISDFAGLAAPIDLEEPVTRLVAPSKGSTP